jgi:hypothetical protein
MRLALVAVLVFGLSAVVTAQSHAPRSTEFDPFPRFGLPLPQIGLPLPSIGLPLAPIGLPDPRSQPAPGLGFDRSNRRFDHGGGERGGQGAGRRGRERSGGTVLYYVPFYGWPYIDATTAPAAPAAPEKEKPRLGRLRLEAQRGLVAQIFIDGYFVGTLDEFSGDLTLDAGPHHVELRADGYERLEVDVQVPADRPITYRGTLKPLDAAPAPVPPVPPSTNAPPPPPAPATIYMIPGCYVGNVPPHDAGLPAGCDERLAITFKPRS